MDFKNRSERVLYPSATEQKIIQNKEYSNHMKHHVLIIRKVKTLLFAFWLTQPIKASHYLILCQWKLINFFTTQWVTFQFHFHFILKQKSCFGFQKAATHDHQICNRLRKNIQGNINILHNMVTEPRKLADSIYNFNFINRATAKATAAGSMSWLNCHNYSKWVLYEKLLFIMM